MYKSSKSNKKERFTHAFLIKHYYIIIIFYFIDEDDPLADLLADKDFSSGQKNLVGVRDKSIIDDLFNKKVSNESLSSFKPSEKENNLTSALSTTGIDKSKVTDEKARKLSLMQDLFGNTLHISPSKESNASKKSVQIEQGVTQHATEPRIQSQHSTYAPTAFGTREPRRGKRTSEIINDPLGLFSLSMSNQTEKTVNTSLICVYV